MTSCHSNRLVGACAASLIFLGSLPVTAEPLPAAGYFEPGLEAFDRTVRNFMITNQISAGQAAIMRNGKVIFDRAYGWHDKEHVKVLEVGALMRVASVTKPFTGAAIRRLIGSKRLSLDDHVFNLHQQGGGVLDLDPPTFGTLDPRLKDITIQHCLLHIAGWDRHGRDKDGQEVGDLTYFEIKAAKALDLPSPPGKINMARYIMVQPLQFDPGARRAYSNIGYLLLGLVIEKVSGQDYLSFLRENVTRAAGIADADLVLARSMREDADPREPYYDEPQLRPNVFFPAHTLVPLLIGVGSPGAAWLAAPGRQSRRPEVWSASVRRPMPISNGLCLQSLDEARTTGPSLAANCDS
jgi:CubicO group peptidase (beta-lactamase class C family)